MVAILKPFHELFLQEIELSIVGISESGSIDDEEHPELIFSVRVLKRFIEAEFTSEQLQEIIPRIERIWGSLEEMNLYVYRDIFHKVMQDLEQRLEATTPPRKEGIC